jgi:uncharacterized protein
LYSAQDEKQRMINKDIIKQIIRQFHESTLPETISRNLELPVGSGKVISLIGARRCGKTYLLFDTIKKLTAQGIPVENILFLNFEDERLSFQMHELDLIIQAWHELHNGSASDKHYFFFDEIQNINGWEKFVRRLYDTETLNIFISGSNSAFLATDIATSMRGRTLNFEVFPFSFDEYLRYKAIDIDYYSPAIRSVIINEFDKYIRYGSFPETIGKNTFQYNETLRAYYYVMLYKDLIERYNINSASVLKHFIEKLVDNLTKGFSLNKVYNTLRSMGLALDKNLIYNLIIYIENIYLAFKIERYDYSLASRKRSDKKVYFIDNGLARIITHQFSTDIGKLLENAVFIYLRQKLGSLYENNIFYFKENTECDFIVFDRDRPTHCIQVCYDISDTDTRKREIKGLIGALHYFKLDKGYIITAEHEEEFEMDGKQIYIRPAYKVFIQNQL